jgi:hypothetical protein
MILGVIGVIRWAEGDDGYNMQRAPLEQETPPFTHTRIFVLYSVSASQSGFAAYRGRCQMQTGDNQYERMDGLIYTLVYHKSPW